jgi:hypothetical protein
MSLHPARKAGGEAARAMPPMVARPSQKVTAQNATTRAIEPESMPHDE